MKVEQQVSGIKKYTPSFEYTKQIAKERFGKASNSVDTFDTRTLKEKISHIKHTLHDVKASGIDYIDHMSKLTEKGAAFSEALTAFGRLGLEDSPLAPTVCMVGDMIKNYSATTKASSMSTSSQVLSPLIKFYEEELAQIQSLKHDQERIRVQFEAQQAKLKDYQKRGSSKKLSIVEANTILVKENYDNVTNELQKRCDVLIEKMEVTLMPSLQAYIAFQAAFFGNLAEQWKRMEKNMALASYTPRPEDMGDGAGAGGGYMDRAESSRMRSQSSPPAPAAGLASM